MINKLIPIYDKFFDQCYWYINAKTSKEFADVLSIAGRIDVEIEINAAGECITLDDGVIAFWAPIDNIALVSHEVLHAVFSCLNGKGMRHCDESEEAYCRGLELLMSRIYPNGDNCKQND